MKRIVIVVAAGLAAAGALSAQAFAGRGAFGQAAAVQAAETVKVEGKLALVNGMIAVKEKDKTYYVGGIGRLVGFVDGLKEGASVKLEGYAFEVPAAPEYLHLRATKLTLGGKDYDLSQAFGRGMGGGCAAWGGAGATGGAAWGGPGMMGGGRGRGAGRGGRF